MASNNNAITTSSPMLSSGLSPLHSSLLPESTMSLVPRGSAGWLLNSNNDLLLHTSSVATTPIHNAFVVSDWLEQQQSLFSSSSSSSSSLPHSSSSSPQQLQEEEDDYEEGALLFSIRGGSGVCLVGDYTLVAFEDLWDDPHRLPFITATTTEAPRAAEATASGTPLSSSSSSTTTTTTTIDDLDMDLLSQAEEHAQEQRLLEAARLLSKIQDPRRLQDQHIVILEKARLVEGLIQDHARNSLLDSNVNSNNDNDNTADNANGGWIRHGTTHGDRHSVMYYKVGPNPGEMTVRMETPVEASLLVPLVSVFHEFQLWQTWVPRFTKPFCLGLRCSRILQKMDMGMGMSSRGCQMVQGIVDLPWPLRNRDTVLEVLTVDDIEGHHGAIYIKVFSHHHDTKLVHVDGVPHCEPGADRMEFDGGISFRPCPPNHPSLLVVDQRKRPSGSLPDNNNNDNNHNNKEDKEPLLLMTFTAYMRPTVNLIVKTFFPPTWQKLMRVAEGIRDGKLPQYGNAMNEQQELYDWVQERMNILIRQSSSSSSRRQEEHDPRDETRLENSGNSNATAVA